MVVDMLTDMLIRKLSPRDREYVCREKGGFGVRVLPTGRKTFFYSYRIDDDRRFFSLGAYKDKQHPDGITLAKAREDYEIERAKVKALKAGRAEGVDPVAVKRAKRAEREAQRNVETVNELIKEYLKHAEKTKRSWKEDKRILTTYIPSSWGERRINEIAKRDIKAMLKVIVDRGAPVMANNTFKVVRRMFNYAVDEDLLALSPATRVKMPTPLKSRARVLSEDEIKTAWKSLDAANMTDGVRRALKLILVTAQRPDEVAGMHACEIKDRWWTIPGERTKNGCEQRVYLTDLALELIGGAENVDPVTGEKTPKTFIFPTPHKKKAKAIQRHALSKAVVNNCPSGCVYDCVKCRISKCKEDGRLLEEKNLLGIPHFVPHDLRRTAATFMAQVGEYDEVIDAMLNHVKEGVIKFYNKYRYDKEKKAALENWERELVRIVVGASAGQEEVAPIDGKIVDWVI